jgi:hypothetical protein
MPRANTSLRIVYVTRPDDDAQHGHYHIIARGD